MDMAVQGQINFSVSFDPKWPVFDLFGFGCAYQNLIVRSKYVVRTKRIGWKLLRGLGTVRRCGIGARLLLRVISRSLRIASLSGLSLLSQDWNADR